MYVAIIIDEITGNENEYIRSFAFQCRVLEHMLDISRVRNIMICCFCVQSLSCFLSFHIP